MSDYKKVTWKTVVVVLMFVLAMDIALPWVTMSSFAALSGTWEILSVVVLYAVGYFAISALPLLAAYKDAEPYEKKWAVIGLSLINVLLGLAILAAFGGMLFV